MESLEFEIKGMPEAAVDILKYGLNYTGLINLYHSGYSEIILTIKDLDYIAYKNTHPILSTPPIRKERNPFATLPKKFSDNVKKNLKNLII